jgi:biopolymer transport protein ExbB/TolQ
MKRGVNSLATIASVAPLLGLFITVEGIVFSFVSCDGEKSTCLAAVVDRLSNAIARTALGLLVGIPSLWCYRYLRSQLEDLDVEMRNAALELANVLSGLVRRRHSR